MTKLPALAYWFAAEPRLPHGDNRPVVIGETLRVKPPLKLCEHGLHWSVDPFDALLYANGNLLYQVRPDDSDWYDNEGQWHKGEYLLGDDKGCSTGRTALAVRDATDMLHAFRRDEALRVIHLWDAPEVVRPEVVRRYLETGDETIRAAAVTTAEAAAWIAAWAAGETAAWAAVVAAERAKQRQRFNAAVARLFAEPAP